MSRLLAEWARRHTHRRAHGNAVTDLKAGLSDIEVAERRGLPLASVAGIRTFYDQIGGGLRVCTGTACRFAAENELQVSAARAGRAVHDVRCLGHCYDAPAVMIDDTVVSRGNAGTFTDLIARGSRTPGAHARPIPRRSMAAPPVVLRNLLGEHPHHDFPDEYDLPSGDEILAAIEAVALHGRGGAAFPTAAKWRAARETPSHARVVVANGDEGDPGSYVDRLLLEEDPHAILAGMVACGRAIGADSGVVYIRAEYPLAQERMRAAIDEARALHLLDDTFDVEVVSGAGSYVCGEETALLNSIEGFRGEPRPKPPYPAQAGLFGLPTVVQNVETLAVIPWIARTRQAAGTKALCLSGAVNHPGIVEVPFGTPLRQVLNEAGGGAPPGRAWKMAVVGGPMGRVLPERMFDLPVSFTAMPGLGHGGIVVLDESVSAADLARHLYSFARAESCGSCTPCRVGTARLADMRDVASLERLLRTIEMGSLCGFGAGVPRPIRDLLEFFPGEVLPC